MKANDSRLTFRLLLPALLVAAVAHCGGARLAADDRPARPNFLFLFSDDQRADAVA